MKSRQDFTTKKGYHDYLLAYYTAIALPHYIMLATREGVDGDFEKKTNILLKYDYKEHKERKILVKHITG